MKHKKMFLACLDAVRAKNLDYEVSHATSTSSSYLTIYVNGRDGEWAGEYKIRFSDHPCGWGRDEDNDLDVFVSGCKMPSILKKIEALSNLNNSIPAGWNKIEI